MCLGEDKLNITNKCNLEFLIVCGLFSALVLGNLIQSQFECHLGTSVVQVTATDADDPTYGNSARVVYSILQGQPYFSVEPKTGMK
jgi:hypothetical protein